MSSYKITASDYKKILKYYNKSIPFNKLHIKKAGEDILSLKLCQCIKKINPSLQKGKEPRAIGICTRSIINNKGLSRGKFKCLKKRSISIKKTHRNLSLGNKRKTMKRKT